MKGMYQSTLLRMRLLVGFLGERTQFAWWPTGFYESSSELFLEPCFPKTVRLAQYHGVVEAARRAHDEHLSVGSYHLFRLPEEIEQDLHRLVLGTSEDELHHQWPHDRAGALEALGSLAGSGVDEAVGPVAVGRIQDLDSPAVLKSMAAGYRSAFSKGTRTYPYLMARS